MKWLRALLLVAAVGAGIAVYQRAGDEGSDPRCNVSNCAAMMSCGIHSVPEPNLALCEAKGLAAEPVDESEYCVTACNAAGLGEFFECFARRAGECVDSYDKGFLVATECSKARPTDCLKGCVEARMGCEATCPSTSWADCRDCVAACGLQYGACSNRC
ncbi:hypothetical protein [Vulgatibacter incomptus]|uniref:Uncharacterized protein n=1 Tax=Vulgatibacter incomptus TaxID=1391653 RepID=A0A0K1PFU3_9BACT|nr:hypothetical protein [Vulgatibacter incomptus]AKU91984.1 hypothetical protein AKJ08_2371 [Vulgatibacter incomptus]